MLIFYSIVFILFSVIYFYRKWYIGELIISFLPYFCVTLFLIVLSNIIITIKSITEPNFYYYFIFLIPFSILLGLYLYEIFSFYNKKHNKSNFKKPIKLLYANIFANNPDYEDIEKILIKENPDLILFTEFSEEHESALVDFLDKNKIHLHKKNWIKLCHGNAVYSKFSVTNFSKDLGEDVWTYGYFQIIKGGQPYYFYLVHPNSPVSKDYYFKRNQQLKILGNDICENYKKDDKVVMVGDFNTSPRSNNYKEFSNLIDGKLENITRREKFLFTRNFGKVLDQNTSKFSFIPNWIKFLIKKFPILSHIDHAFVSKTIHSRNFKKISFRGSDHDGFVFEIE